MLTLGGTSRYHQHRKGFHRPKCPGVAGERHLRPAQSGRQAGAFIVWLKSNSLLTYQNQAAESYAPNSPSPHPENHSSLLNEINLLRTYLPTAPSSDQLRTIITEIISGLTNDSKGAKGNSNANAAIGEVMKSLWEKLGDQKAGVDKKEVGKLVSELLKGK